MPADSAYQQGKMPTDSDYQQGKIPTDSDYQQGKMPTDSAYQQGKPADSDYFFDRPGELRGDCGVFFALFIPETFKTCINTI